MTDHPDRTRQAEPLPSLVELAEERTSPHLGDLALRIDDHAADRSQIDDHSTVAGREPGNTVPAASHGDREPLLAGEPECCDHVCLAGATGDQGGMPIHHAVP